MEQQVDRYLTHLETERGFSQNTISAYRNDLTQFLNSLKQDGLGMWQEVGEAQLTTFVLFLRERGYARSTIARKVAAIRSFCGFLTEQGIFRGDPSENLVSPKVEKSTPRAMTTEEMQALLEQFARGETPESLRDVAMLYTLYSTGMRVSEMMALDLNDVDLEHGVATCGNRPDKIRQAPLGRQAVEALGNYLTVARPLLRNSEDTDALFLNHRGARLTRQGFWLILKAHSETAGIPAITPHTIRHSFAVHQLSCGRDMRDVQRIMGHMSIATTQAYSQLVNPNGVAHGNATESSAGHEDDALAHVGVGSVERSASKRDASHL